MFDDATYMNAVHRTLKRGDVIRIKSKPPFESEKHHFFVVLNIDPASEDVLLLVSGTSQVQKRLEVRLKTSNDDGQYIHDTTKVFPVTTYDFFTMPTLFDCNEVHTVKLEVVERKNLLVDNFSLSDSDVLELVGKVGNSRLVAPVIKRQLGI